MKKYIEIMLSEYIVNGSLSEAKQCFTADGIKAELHKVIFNYFATKVHNSGLGRQHRFERMAKIEPMIYNKINSLLK